MNQISFKCQGHENILSKHKSTLEFTTDSCLTSSGDCIIGVNSSISLRDIPQDFKKLIQNEKSRITITLQVGEKKEEIHGFGDSALQLSDSRAMIIRKSTFICPRTLAIRADKAACDISKDIVDLMKNPKSELKVIITVEV
jgi:hypothetical protein